MVIFNFRIFSYAYTTQKLKVEGLLTQFNKGKILHDSLEFKFYIYDRPISLE